MSSLKAYLLPSVVFLTGASVLIVEVLAVRILSPFYGNTIFTVSSVISVILLALSAGYYAGGALADRRPSLQWFFGLILVSGIVLLAFQAAGAVLLPRFSGAFSIELGPLFSAAFLFLLPAFFLGMLSPYAVRLQSSYVPSHGVGRVAGEIFFWSTLGSISGSLLAGFVLIPRFGIDRILMANGCALIVLGLGPLLALRASRARVGAAGAAALVVGVVAYAGTRPAAAVLYQRDGVYQRITIYEGEHLGRPARFLLLDRSESGAMFLDTRDQTDLAYDYTKYYALYKVFAPDVRRALVLGGGAYSIPKALLRELPSAEVDVAEIEPSLFDLSKKYFDVVDNPRLHNHVEDGRRFLQDATAPYDLIFGDVYYSYYSVPPHFTTQEFFALARDRLAPGGVFIANMIGDLSRRQPSLIMSELRTFQDVFPNSYFFAVEAPEKTGLIQNITLVGSTSDRRIDVRSPPVTTSPNPLIRFLQYKALDIDHRYELSVYPVLTDSYAPVEYLTARALARSLVPSFTVSGDEMLAVVGQQLRYGSREPGSRGHDHVRDFLLAEMQVLAQEVETQVFDPIAANGGTSVRTNIIGRLHDAEARRVIVAAHYAGAKEPEGAGGPALLLELARTLITMPVAPRVGVDIVLLDAAGGNWFIDRLQDFYGTEGPLSAVLVDSACGGGIEVLEDATRLRDRDLSDGAGTIDRCTARNLETAANRVLAYVNSR
jgi:spermidine synthase